MCDSGGLEKKKIQPSKMSLILFYFIFLFLVKFITHIGLKDDLKTKCEDIINDYSYMVLKGQNNIIVNYSHPIH